MAGIF